MLLAGLAAFHAWASWGYAGPMWSEHGRWLAGVERFANGEVPYRDFEWSNPPLGLWIVGTVARVTGTGLAAISATTLVVYLAVLAVFFLVVNRLAREVALPVTLASLLFAFAYASRSGAPLPLGTATLSIPFGVFFLLCSGLGAHALYRGGGARPAALTGVFAGLTMACAHAMWLPALYMVVAGVVLLRRASRQSGANALLAGFGVVIAVWLTLQAVTSGAASIAGVLTGFDLIGPTLIGAQPSLERLTIEAATIAAIVLTATTALWLCLAISDGAASRWAGTALLVFLCASAAHLGMSVARGTQLAAQGPSEWPSLIETSLMRSLVAGRALIPAALALLDERFQAHLFPVLLPAFLLTVLASRWRAWADPDLRNLLAMLLGLCLAARLRNGFRGSDWYNVLLEVPTYVLMLRLGGAARIHQAGRAVLAALAIMIVLGVYMYGSLARGRLTFRGTYPGTATARGMVRWSGTEAQQYQDALRQLDEADATRARPLFAFGPTAGFNYFLGRRNPTPVQQGLFAQPGPKADSIATALRSAEPPVLLLDHPFVRRAVPRGFAPWRWDPQMGPSPHMVEDRPRFERLIAGCALVGAPDSTVAVRIYDCR